MNMLKKENVAFTTVALCGIANDSSTVACFVGVLPGTCGPTLPTAIIHGIWDVFDRRGIAGDDLMIQVSEYQVALYLHAFSFPFSFEDTYGNGALFPGCSLGRQGDSRYGSFSFMLEVRAEDSTKLLGVTCGHVGNPDWYNNGFTGTTIESPSAFHHDMWNQRLRKSHQFVSECQTIQSFSCTVGQLRYATAIPDTTSGPDPKSRLDVAIFDVNGNGRTSTNDPYIRVADYLNDYGGLGNDVVSMAGARTGATIGIKLSTSVAVALYHGTNLITETIEKCIVPCDSGPGVFARPGDSGALVFDAKHKAEGIVWGGGDNKPASNNTTVPTSTAADVALQVMTSVPGLDASKFVYYTELKHVKDYIQQKLDSEYGTGNYEVLWGSGGQRWI
ncbi:uncharacterized protein BCR38DRAFT_426153 [Pseudomassariella vexata]|uniref:Uncharacterized protein n=1 Tax=Pseudomassariella vexata TaxID=1141098 RepID=A0A1Y2E6D5_9PEZI|nr:uncharacterized protein BCR38DRAFT_426153 [Pseudomassariella vexata]ORY67133.1 hypothetical protein BCR38DRAFT_426153 [Pseudomassariella vexata]